MALITSLLLITFLLVLGVAFLSFSEQEYRFAGQHGRSSRSYYLALSGVDYYRLRTANFSVGVPQTYAVPPGDPHEKFEVVVEGDGTVRSRGFIVDGDGRVWAERTLVLPSGNLAEMYDESQ